MILHSWERSRHLPREMQNPVLTKEQLEQIIKECRVLMDASYPVEQLLSVCMLHTMVFLNNENLYTIHQICHEKYMNQVGRTGREDIIGTFASNLCMREGIPVQTTKQENYALRYQHCSIASAPIFDGAKNIVGAVSLVTNFGVELPDNALSTVAYAVKLVEQRLNGMPFLPLLDCEALNEFLDQSKHGILIADSNGVVRCANGIFKRAFNISGDRAIIGRGLAQLIDNPSELSVLQDVQDMAAENITVTLMNKEVKCLLSEQISAGADEDRNLLVMVFDLSGNSAPLEDSRSAILTNNVWLPPESKIYLVGESPAWHRVKQMIEKVSSVRTVRVLIEGESGTGKEQIAKAIHAASNRKGKMITLNCGALPKELLQSELFGYVDGAFTGAKRGGNPGKFEEANEGTLFLDEIGEMPLDMQISLLRVLEDRRVVRLGSSKPINVDLTIIAATNKNLMNEVAEGRFREDLYYRLSAVVISAPALRQRKSDIPLLARHLVMRLADSMNIAPREISDGAIKALEEYDWPGNVRELLNVLEHALIMEDGTMLSQETIKEVLGIRSMSIKDTGFDTHQMDLKSLTEEQKAETIRMIVNDCGGNISKAAKQLNVSRNTIYRYWERDH
ncbi:MAG: sigma 54-interacting transcriptional regulator [Oscillospiraceae bacterium]